MNQELEEAFLTTLRLAEASGPDSQNHNNAQIDHNHALMYLRLYSIICIEYLP